MPSSHVLVLHLQPARREQLSQIFKAAGFVPVPAASPAEAARALAVPGLELAVIDLNLPGLDQTLLREALAPGEAVQPEPLDAVERRHIARTLDFTRGNKRRAAHLLGIARSTLLAKVRKYGLEPLGSAEGT